jgi:hypothetical protein
MPEISDIATHAGDTGQPSGLVTLVLPTPLVGNGMTGVGVTGMSTESYGVSAQSVSTFALCAKGAHGAALLDGSVTINGDVTVNANIAAVKSVTVSGDINFANGDCAEHFDQVGAVPLEPGTVVVIDGLGAIGECRAPYDRKVAGVIAGAGCYRPAIVLDSQASDTCRPLVALVGKTQCKADATYAAIEVGDLMTTSQTPGHAMKASDLSRAFGAVIGKALAALPTGRGLVPILIALQ